MTYPATIVAPDGMCATFTESYIVRMRCVLQHEKAPLPDGVGQVRQGHPMRCTRIHDWAASTTGLLVVVLAHHWSVSAPAVEPMVT